MRIFKNIVLVSIVLMSMSSLAQDFTPYYFDNEYNNYKRTSETNSVEGDFDYSFSSVLDYYGYKKLFYRYLLYTTVTDDSLYCTVEYVYYNKIVVRYFDKEMNLLHEYENVDRPERFKKVHILDNFVRNDTIFQISWFANTADDKTYFFCETYNLKDATYNSDRRKIAELPYIQKGMYYYAITSENKNYFGILSLNFTWLRRAPANKCKYLLLDRNFELVLRKDSLVSPTDLFDKYPPLYIKNYWNDKDLEIWMQNIKLSNKGQLSFFCMAGSYKNSNATFDYQYITKNVERAIPINFCFISVPNDDIEENKEILVSLGANKFIQDLDYKLLDNDSVLFTAFYRTKEDFPHNIASFKCSLDADKAEVKSEFHFDRSFRRQYATQDEKEDMIQANAYNINYFSNIYKTEAFIEFNGGYINIYSSYMTYEIIGDVNFQGVYTLDYFLVYCSENGDIIDTYKIPQRRMHLSDEPNLLFTTINDELYVVFTDSRLYLKDVLYTNFKDIANLKIKYTKFVVYKFDKDFNISQYTCPIDFDDFKVVRLEEDLWFSNSEILALGHNPGYRKNKFIKIDLEKLINAE